MNRGKIIRVRKLTIPGTDRFFFVPIDHGITVGPLEGLKNIHKTISEIDKGGATGIIMHKGLINEYISVHPRNCHLILHLSGSTNYADDVNRKVLVATVEEALKYGADAVSVHINIGSKYEHEMLKDLGSVSRECEFWGIPLIAMMYVRGEKIKNPFAADSVSHAVRVAYELGADIIKTVYTGSKETFREVIESVPVPIVIAGGEKINDLKAFFKLVEDSMQAGAKGVSIGRNIFQAENIELVTNLTREIILGKTNAEESCKMIHRKFKNS